MAQAFNVAILGASGAVGESLIEILEARNFPVNEIFPLASAKSAGNTVSFKGKNVRIQNVEEFDWSTVEIAFFSAGGSVSEKWAPIAADAGCVVIDNTSHFRNDPDIPLVVPEINPHALADFRNRNIIANPNCSTIQMLVALAPIHQHYGIERINVCTYQSVSGAGRSAIEALAKQCAQLLNGLPVKDDYFGQQMAFNCLPKIDDFMDNGFTKEEMKMVWETQKILGDASIQVNATAVRVPVFHGHGEAVHLETRQPTSVDEVKALLANAPGVELMDADADYPTQVGHATGKDEVFVGRIRQDLTHPCGLNMWVVADNIRKGAALNAVQIAETLIADYL
ncbi:aspartate-semialdehyde dehydrogenase [Ferrimonas aestuarii]|uniref:Aspartate-semialdehyde dehydrogenase n=1 Tax=Ferrimonas aestuarii TaxID=2569539 RepID=A0A4U1BLS2_9GAMM|nr:aspartate-semialdehyde dehydrogenase [Ferrimonas aestuarii]TKB53922.1 aspartate-semialdehyde dehydrogenase [Ferrimonas aestuarii]